MVRDADRDDLEDVVDDVLDAILSGEAVDPSDDVDVGIDQDTPTAGGDEVGGTTFEFDEDRDVDEPPVRTQCRFCEQEFRTLTFERRHQCDGRRDLELSEDDGRPLIDPQLHKFSGKFLDGHRECGHSITPSSGF
ncbi:hypothetical protein [Natrialbaceae archaeon AArc-T1-2]|uniref:hypothetical protein n=1 Tax=Natrialbaceae archaeon AArc-T1-2 TaxID=3053904 RepID=UPI00255A7108|nr:hypothetical protein [Natrialbaceae archaeon AArc-T1-2]WIV68241.1 hypothetical protein QQ977_05815 [Natrialbaceae archaeon AArc-T1-2]